MNFQTTLPYATDSGLHVIEGLDVTGIPIYQRAGLDRFLPVDMYTLLQGIIERCLATQQSDGSYTVSPTIFDETMYSTTDHISYAPISKWIERTYPGGALNEVTGYVANLMDMYPQNLILQAIDDKLWLLGNSGDAGKSIYGNLKDTPLYWEAFDDITYAMTQAGVGFDPASFEMVLIPARASGTGADVYGAPSGAVRIYPEMLIARYKVMQELRYKKASISDTRRYVGTAVGNSHWDRGEFNSWPLYWDNDYVSGLYDEACQSAEDNWQETVGAVQPSGPSAYWVINRGFKSNTQSYGVYWKRWWQGVLGYNGASAGYWGPRFMIDGGYTGAGLTHDVYMWGWWDGAGEPDLYQQFDGTDIVAGKNLVFRVNTMSVDTLFMAWRENAPDLYFPPFPFWPPSPYSVRNINAQLTIQAAPPIEDWKFEFCKHSDFGGDVTWHV